MRHLKIVTLCLVLFLSMMILNQSIPPASATAITRIQTKSNVCYGDESCASLTITLASAPSAGRSVILAIAITDNTGVVYSMTVSVVETGVTWTQDKKGDVGHQKVLLYHGSVAASASATITITPSTTVDVIFGIAAEYSIPVTVDKTEINFGSSTKTATTGTTVTTAYANELWIGVIGADQYGVDYPVTQTSPTNSFTLLNGTSYYWGENYALGYLEKIVSSTGTANSGTTLAHNCYTYAGLIVTYYEQVGPDFTITNSGSMQVVAGSSNTTTITITNILSNPLVNLTCTSGLPSGASCSFNPSTGYATYSSTLTISTTTATLGGTYSITVRGTSSSVHATTIVGLSVFDFTLSTVVNVNVYQGQSSTYTNWVTATLSQGPSTTVSFSLTSVPYGVTYSFTDSSCSVTCTSTLQVTATDSVAAQSYGVALSVTGGYQTHTRAFSLTVVVPTVTVTGTITTTSTIVTTSKTTVLTTLTTTTTSRSTVPVGTTTQILISYTSTDIPLVLYGMAAFFVLMPSIIVVLITKSVPGMLIGFVSGTIWAIVSGVLPIAALLLMIGVAVVAIIFRVRG